MFKVIFTMAAMLLLALFVVSVISAAPMGDMVCTVPETTIMAKETECLPPVTEPETTVAIPAEPITEPETEAITESPSTVSYYNVNLSVEVQECIITECGKYNIPPEIIIAMIERESRFNANAIGDNGNSFGLMQIQPYWHSQRMAKLGCTNLLDPIQNVKVGIDLLGELYNRYGNIGLALTAYNTGNIKNGLNNYAKAIIARANEDYYG